MQHKAVREIIIRRIAAESEKKWVSLAAFLDECESPEIQNLLTEAVAENRKIPSPGQQREQLAVRMRNQYIDRALAALNHRLGQPETSELEKVELQRQADKLRAINKADALAAIKQFGQDNPLTGR